MPKGFVWYGGEDGFQPESFTLDQGPVQSVQTSVTDPKVAFDETGIWITDATGNKLVQLTPTGIVFDGEQAAGPGRMIEWDYRTANGGGFGRGATIDASLNPVGNAAALDLQVFNPGGSETSISLFVDIVGPGNPEGYGDLRVFGNSGGKVARMLESGGHSSYLMADSSLSTPVGSPVVFSKVLTGTLTWPAGSAFSNVVGINFANAGGTVHGLVTPNSNVTTSGGGFFDAGLCTLFALNNSVQIQGKTSGGGVPGAGATMNYAALVWGPDVGR